MIEKLALGVGLVLVIEGLAYALFPTFLQTMIKKLPMTDTNTLRIGGVLALATGVLVLWLIN